jgi:hypothetical protein
VPAMKLTFTAAMRARDVSRPRAEHLAAAEAAEPGAGAAGSGGPGSAGAAGQANPAGAAGQANPAGAAGQANRAVPPGGSRDKAKPSRVAAAMDERRGQAGFPRRRRGRPSR